MKKLFAIFAATLFATSMFAVKFTYADFKGKGTAETGSDVSVTKDGVTVSATRAFGHDTSFRIYGDIVDQTTKQVTTEGGTLTITADKKIVKIAAEFEQNTKKTFDPVEPNANEWSIKADKQIRIVTLIVTREGETEEVIEGPKNLGEKTITEFLSLKNTKDTCVLTGTVSDIQMDKNDATKYNAYGNFNLNGINGDAAKVWIYGLLSAAGEKQKFIEMGINAGDTVTLKGVYHEKDGNPEIVYAVYISHKKAAGQGGGSGEGGTALKMVGGYADLTYIEMGVADLNLWDYTQWTEPDGSGYIYPVGDGHWLELVLYPESEDGLSGTFTVADETLDAEYSGKDTAWVEFTAANVVIAIKNVVEDEYGPIATLNVKASLTGDNAKVYTIDGDIDVDVYLPEEEAVENVAVKENEGKVIMHEGKLYIINNGKVYGISGARVQ